ncbi:hypothetical protein, partial [Methylovulum sp.]|uniref:hypothetical protein n=1 Tax=Methylovulum sp. TaxID=1916980 RepID=UPI00261A2D4B
MGTSVNAPAPLPTVKKKPFKNNVFSVVYGSSTTPSPKGFSVADGGGSAPGRLMRNKDAYSLSNQIGKAANASQ